MKLSFFVLLLAAGASALASTPTTSAPTAAPFHCQVPCGIYGDQMRIQMLMEDCATIEKGMAQIGELEAATPLNYNQIVRWVTTKDAHAQAIQQTCLDYWLAQRIKAPAAGADEAASSKYHRQLELMHGIIVSAMKCKQTTDAANVAAIREKVNAFSATYFSKEDLEHMREHHDEKGH